jgi:hypothetical protein
LSNHLRPSTTNIHAFMSLVLNGRELSGTSESGKTTTTPFSGIIYRYLF